MHGPAPATPQCILPASKLAQTYVAGLSVPAARGHMDGELAWIISDILAHRGQWWVPGKIVEARRQLRQYWQREGAPRDILLLDVALDSFFRLRIEQLDKGSLGGEARGSWG